MLRNEHQLLALDYSLNQDNRMLLPRGKDLGLSFSFCTPSSWIRKPQLPSLPVHFWCLSRHTVVNSLKWQKTHSNNLKKKRKTNNQKHRNVFVFGELLYDQSDHRARLRGHTLGISG